LRTPTMLYEPSRHHGEEWQLRIDHHFDLTSFLTLIIAHWAMRISLASRSHGLCSERAELTRGENCRRAAFNAFPPQHIESKTLVVEECALAGGGRERNDAMSLQSSNEMTSNHEAIEPDHIKPGSAVGAD